MNTPVHCKHCKKSLGSRKGYIPVEDRAVDCEYAESAADCHNYKEEPKAEPAKANKKEPTKENKGL